MTPGWEDLTCERHLKHQVAEEDHECRNLQKGSACRWWLTTILKDI